MRRYNKRQLDKIVELLTQGLTEAGFTGVTFERVAIPQASWEALLKDSGGDEELAESDPTAFGEEICYHRVTTDQAAFGLWLEPYPTLDLVGTGVAQAFLPPEALADPSMADWSFVGLDEPTFKELFVELAKKSRQP